MARDFPVDRYVVRVRRMADLSQRDLAAALGLSKTSVSRIESARRDTTVATFAGILALADLRLAVVDQNGDEVDPVAEDTVRDNAGRRFPAHLDVDPPDVVPPLRRLMPRHDRPPARGWYRLRDERDRLRELCGTPGDHPTSEELRERGRQVAQQRVAAARTRWSALASEPAAALRWAECDCETACWLGTTCEPECPCQCEPATRSEPA